MLSEATLRFVSLHREDDVRQLALHGCRDEGVDMPSALQQIAGWQTARRKLPLWAATEGLLYPPHLSMEQCSSEPAARYKATVAQETVAPLPSRTFVDLTGGLGVDFSFLSRVFPKAVYVERQEELCRLARHNFGRLGIEAQVVCGNATDYLRQMPPATMIFLDPARRDEHGSRTYDMAQCTPNVLELEDLLLQKADFVMLKLSPMLDWQKAVSDLGNDVVAQVHIVAIGGECKELLLILTKPEKDRKPALFCVSDHSVFPVTQDLPNHPRSDGAAPRPGIYCYEPDAAVMKAGCFGYLEQRFGVMQVAPNSHLFLSEQPVDGFPGRGFRIMGVSTMNKRELKSLLAGVSQANITTRNFPLSVAELRKRLKLSEGGSCYLLATTLAVGTHVVMRCAKVS